MGLDRQKKYNTIDTNVQPGGQNNASIAGGASVAAG